MNLSDYIGSLKRMSKKDDIPGSVDAYLEDPCPNCGKNLKKYKKCCGNPNGYVGCNCGYKAIPAGGGDGSYSATVVLGGTLTASPGFVDPPNAMSV